MEQPEYFPSDVNVSVLEERVEAHLVDKCVSLQPHLRGSSHMTYLASMRTGNKFVIRVHSPFPKPNPDGTGMGMTTDYKMRSEVATLRYLKRHSKVPVPDILVHDIDSDGQVGGQWMIMEYIDGINADDAWEQTTPEQRERLFISMADMWSEILELRFDSIGSLYESDDSPERYHIGPMTRLPSNNYFTIATPEFHKCGPFSSAKEWLLALARRDLDYTSSLHKPESPEHVKQVIHDILESTDLIASGNSPSSALKLEHIEFSRHNIIVDRDDLTRIVGIVDWEGARVVPTWAMNPNFHSPRESDKMEEQHLMTIMRDRIISRVPVWKSVIGDDCKPLRVLYHRAYHSSVDPAILNPDGPMLFMSPR